MKLISGSSNPSLAANIAKNLKIPLIKAELGEFKNRERRVWIKDSVRGENVCLVQSFTHPVDAHVMETLLMIDALERMGSKKIIVVIPWLGYSLQDKVFNPGEPIAAKVVADIISNHYVKRVFLLDLHSNSIPGFFQVPTEHLTALSIYADFCKQNYDLAQSVIVSPDFGGLKRARDLADKLNLPLINIDKQRDLKTGKVTATAIHGQTTNKIALVFDDVIISGSTVVESAKILKKNGAKQVHFLSTHGIFCDNGQEKIANSQVDSVIITNSIAHNSLHDKIKQLDISPLFSKILTNWQ